MGLLSTWALWSPGLPDAVDYPLHVYRLVEIRELWQEGQLYPRWAPDMLQGYGYPVLNFAPPLLYYLALPLVLGGAGYDLAFKLVLAAGSALGAGFSYRWAREHVSPGAALVAAAAFAFAPFRLRELSLQGNAAQYLALSLLPGLLWALGRSARTGSRGSVLATAVLSASLLLTHNITSLLATPVLLAYLLVSLRWEGRSAWKAAGGLLWGVGLAAFFWLPALWEARWVRVEALTKGFFDFRRHFVGLSDLLAASPILDVRALNPEVPYGAGWPQVALFLAGLGALLVARRALPKRTERDVAFFAVATLVMGLMALPASLPVWGVIPALHLVEFPWRLLGPASAYLVLPAGLGAQVLAEPLGRWRAWALVALALAIPLPQWGLTYAARGRTSFDGAGPAEIQAFERQSGAIGTTAGAEFLPRSSPADVWERIRRPGEVPPPGAIDPATVPLGGRVEPLGTRGLSRAYRVTLPQQAWLRIGVLSFPGWQAELDGAPLPTEPDAGTGFLTVKVPAGEGRLDVSYGTTADRLLGALVSGLAAAAFVAALAGLGRGVPVGHDRPGRGAAFPSALVGAGRTWPEALRSPALPDRLPALAALGTLAGLALLWGARAAYIDPRTTWFLRRSPPMEVAGVAHPTSLTLGRAVHLLGYEVRPRTVSPGGTVQVTLYWQAERRLTEELASFVHLTLPATTEVIAQEDHGYPGGITTLHWLPDRYVRDEHVLRLPMDIPAAALVPRVGLYPAGAPLQRLPVTAGDPVATQARPSLLAGADHVVLDPVWVERTAGPPPHPVQPPARFAASIVLEGYAVEAQPDVIELRLWWRSLAPVEGDWKVFAHLVDADGMLVDQSDQKPAQGTFPTDWWRPGERVIDVHRLARPAARGSYQILVGLYDPTTGERASLAVGETSVPASALLLTPLEID